ncbi:LysR family transcriptional regulator, partial [Aquisalimonas lutea]|uniref:LysR family transcriptional regulator n=1 Tax=Aquisalimonas lutea TaxID=1327750 RepID=UPI0025B5BC2A
MVDELETLGGSLEDVRAFCAVAEFGTVSAAARQLGETKGGVSRRVSRLERRLGVRLLARTPRAVTPTEEGAAFHAKAREALAWLDDAAEGARQSQAVPRGHLRVTAPVDLGMDVLPELVVQFRALHPQITVELVLTDAPIDLAAHRVDLALRATADDLPDMGYRASMVARFRIGLYASPGYLAASGNSPATPADLADHSLVAARAPAGGAQ